MKQELKTIWKNKFTIDWKLGLILLLLICIPRFFLVLNANKIGNYGAIGIVMLISACIPFLFLNGDGLKNIGLQKTTHYLGLFIALFLGVGSSVILYWVGDLMYGTSLENWYSYIGQSYNIPDTLNPDDRLVMFLVVAIPGMIFSPFGEEFFFRGIVHYSFSKSIGDFKASLIDSSAFALTHISHFGLVYIQGQWTFYVLPTIIWVLSMFLVSLLFFQMKKRTNSLWGAVLCHSGFNLGMTYCIFYP